ncbi:diguanylate cyclase [Herbaspirillum rubrisubalbicans]|jgi:diguanylate cyclase (GGDEF)-like protein|uniref:diguanylate cyclase n=2 Tax=Herbaspirillum rubrisubalbicans TaxID=80842 RepID=A0ABX9C1H3_9BURK|nr:MULTISPECIES: GGDEF domain-containing protein [Herbaspirillum]MCP1574240.1 diguanylate cyclase (GGDEF)-like protein [Herbaspirillum rubrisubalbicans]NQE49468.1 diguanylate cyclase [Herbaspirillum rubrisubalbicans]QJQ02719.1 GGDEF domain-containing protein [Herbaspirillum rubrisubalbicans Os34]RAM63964.1 diguanylate cyclase [Herbaspirillum rubrisubalbicans]RAN46944.1 diguanylate cyclase [Herbaspirillum rubrisubalbicans]
MEEVDLFHAEAQALRRASEVLADAASDAAAHRAALEELVQHYGQLMRQSRRLISRSDRTERELNLLNTRLKQLSDELDYKARHDNLTGALNRGAVFERAHQILEQSSMSLIVLDIDFFKRINDEFGHPTGDAVIRELVGRLRTTLADTGVIGRVGGEEFTILLPDMVLEQAVVLAGKIRQAIAGERFQCLPARAVTSSFGVAWAVAGSDFEDAYARADQALYQAKRGGRNRVESEDTVAG